MDLALASASENELAMTAPQSGETETADVASFVEPDSGDPVENALVATMEKSSGTDKAEAAPAVAGQDIAAEQPAPTNENAATAQRVARTTEEASPAPATTQQEVRTAVLTAAPASVEPVAKPERRGFLSSLFSSRQPRPPRAIVSASAAAPVVATAAAAPPPVSPTPQPVAIRTASATPLPGVNAESLFEIKRKSGGYDDSDVDANEGDSPVRVASVTGLARLAPNGLALQREGVDVKCLKPALLRVLKSVERHYGGRVVVTSGYRSPTHNRKVRGARNSLHMYCAAADIQVSGVSKWELASYLRAMPGRGGVGTYCHTNSVHVDIGPERDWNWRCRRKKKKRRK